MNNRAGQDLKKLLLIQMNRCLHYPMLLVMSMKKHGRARQSISFLKSTGSVARSMRIWRVICIIGPSDKIFW